MISRRRRIIKEKNKILDILINGESVRTIADNLNISKTYLYYANKITYYKRTSKITRRLKKILLWQLYMRKLTAHIHIVYKCKNLIFTDIKD